MNSKLKLSLLVVVVSSFMACSKPPPIDPSMPGNGVYIGNEERKEAQSDDIIAKQEEILRRQREEMLRQKRELEDLRRQEYQNRQLKKFEKR